MRQWYPVKKVGDHLHVIGSKKESEFTENDFAISLPNGEKIQVIASTNRALGLPLLPDNIGEEDIKQQARDRFPFEGSGMYPSHDACTNARREGYLIGYKAAKAKEFNLTDVIKRYSEEFNISEREVQNIHFVQFLESLKPIPTEVELEMDWHHASNAGSSAELIALDGFHSTTILFPKVVNNQVIVKGVKYGH